MSITSIRVYTIHSICRKFLTRILDLIWTFSVNTFKNKIIVFFFFINNKYIINFYSTKKILYFLPMPKYFLFCIIIYYI